MRLSVALHQLIPLIKQLTKQSLQTIWMMAMSMKLTMMLLPLAPVYLTDLKPGMQSMTRMKVRQKVLGTASHLRVRTALHGLVT